MSHVIRTLSRHSVIGLLLLAVGMPVWASIPEFRLDEVPEPVRQAIEQARDQLAQAQADRADNLSDAWGHLADVALAHDFSSQARVAYRQALEHEPQRHDWHYLLGLVESSEGNNRAAIGAFGEALARKPGDQPAMLRRGQAWLEEGELDQAEADFRAVLEQAPEAAAAHGGLGRVALQRGDYEQAVQYLSTALELSPGANRLHHMLGMAYRGAGDLDQARYHLDRRGDVLEPVDDPVMARIQMQSRNPQFYLEMGLSQADQGDMRAAVRLLGRAAQLAPNDPRILSNYGEMLARTGELDEAYGVFRHLTRIQPARAQGHFYLGQIQELRGNIESAVQSYRHLLGMTPEDPQVRSALAWALLAIGRFEEAGERFQQAQNLSDQPAQQAVFAYWRGMALLGQEQCSLAEQVLEQARELQSQPDADLLTALARTRASCADADQQSLAEALSWAEAIYQAQPGLMSAETLAMVHARMGKFEDAEDLQAQAMFEAVKRGELEARPWMRENMQRYQNQQPAEWPFRKGDPAFSARLGS